MVNGAPPECKGVSVVVPVYNGAVTLPELTARLDRVFTTQSTATELILVNDGSQDDSWRVIRELADRFGWVRGIDLARNVGQQNALLCGIRQASYALIVTLDDDLQHPPEEIPKLLAALSDDVDLVYGQPARHCHSYWRVAASWLLSWLTRMGKPGGPPRFSAFRAFRTHLREAFADYHAPFVPIDLLLTWSTARVATVAIEHRPRAAGRPGYTLVKLFGLAFDMLHGLGAPSPWFTAGLGLLCGAIGIVGLIVSTFLPLSAGNVGYAPFELAAIVALFTGLQLCILAWFGSYLARLYAAAIGRPPYVIARMTDSLKQIHSDDVEGKILPYDRSR